jgi:TonB family protein
MIRAILSKTTCFTVVVGIASFGLGCVSFGGNASATSELTREKDDCTFQSKGYTKTIRRWIYEEWSIPEAAHQGEPGAVAVHFNITSDGQIRDLKTVRRCGPDSLEAAALQAVTNAGPLPPFLIKGPNCEQVGVTMNFFYNMDARERNKWIRQSN